MKLGSSVRLTADFAWECGTHAHLYILFLYTDVPFSPLVAAWGIKKFKKVLRRTKINMHKIYKQIVHG